MTMIKDYVMNEYEAKGKTVDDAIMTGLTECGMSIDEVDIEILSEGRGLFSRAHVRIVKKGLSKNADNVGAKEFLDELMVKMGIPATAEVEPSTEGISVTLSGDSSGILIGRRGETLDALQYLTSLVVNKGKDGYTRVNLDTENYRKKREDALVKLAHRVALKVERTGKRVVLEPMNPYERRVLHSTLQENPAVQTASEGEEPFRKVVVKKAK